MLTILRVPLCLTMTILRDFIKERFGKHKKLDNIKVFDYIKSDYVKSRLYSLVEAFRILDLNPLKHP
jgi:hypothetical protein